MAKFLGCDAGQIVVTSVAAPDLKKSGCDVFDPDRLKQTGSIALSGDKDGWQMTTARDLAGDRPWTNWPKVDPSQSSLQYVRINPIKRP